jgi:molybdate transport system substrate-binding protein
MRITSAVKFLLAVGVVAAGTALDGATITVFAAASLTDSLKRVATDYEQKSPDRVLFNFAGSSLLARQIEEGAPADIFFSADNRLMDELDKKGLILTTTRKGRLSNSLVIVVPRDSSLVVTSPEDLTNASIGRLALADPKAVPAGVYAREFLEKRHLWAAVQPKVIPTANVRAALAAVESGNVEAGIVYKTDAAMSKQVKVVYEVPAQEGPEIVYPVAVVRDSEHPAAAQRFLEYLESPEEGRVFAGFGFIVRDGTP